VARPQPKAEPAKVEPPKADPHGSVPYYKNHFRSVAPECLSSLHSKFPPVARPQPKAESSKAEPPTAHPHGSVPYYKTHFRSVAPGMLSGLHSKFPPVARPQPQAPAPPADKSAPPPEVPPPPADKSAPPPEVPPPPADKSAPPGAPPPRADKSGPPPEAPTVGEKSAPPPEAQAPPAEKSAPPLVEDAAPPQDKVLQPVAEQVPPATFQLLPSVGTWITTLPRTLPAASEKTVAPAAVTADSAKTSPPVSIAKHFTECPSVGTWFMRRRGTKSRGEVKPEEKVEAKVEVKAAEEPVRYALKPSVGTWLQPRLRQEEPKAQAVTKEPAAQQEHIAAPFRLKPSVGTWLMQLPFEADDNDDGDEEMDLPFGLKPSVGSWLSQVPHQVARPWYFQKETDPVVNAMQKIIAAKDRELDSLKAKLHDFGIKLPISGSGIQTAPSSSRQQKVQPPPAPASARNYPTKPSTPPPNVPRPRSGQKSAPPPCPDAPEKSAPPPAEPDVASEHKSAPQERPPSPNFSRKNWALYYQANFSAANISQDLYSKFPAAPRKAPEPPVPQTPFHLRPSVGTWLVKAPKTVPAETPEVIEEITEEDSGEQNEWNFHPSVGTWLQAMMDGDGVESVASSESDVLARTDSRLATMPSEELVLLFRQELQKRDKEIAALKAALEERKRALQTM